MPELPEVETVRHSLAKLITGKTIARVDVRLPRLVRTPEVELFTMLVRDVQVKEVLRRGKYLLFDLGDYTMISHLRMEGRYGLYQPEDPEETHTHIVFTFEDQSQLRYRDVRQFGTFDLVTKSELAVWAPLQKLGPEPFAAEFHAAYLQQALMRRASPIKAVLLDQTVVAGLGNIYVDEILHQARIHPERSAMRLKKSDIATLVTYTKQVMQDAIAQGGSSIKSYVNGYGSPGEYQFSLRVYGREGLPCLNCGKEIAKGRVGGRGTHVCVTCQKAPRGASIRGSKE